jgi:hypothetical protein
MIEQNPRGNEVAVAPTYSVGCSGIFLLTATRSLHNFAQL